MNKKILLAGAAAALVLAGCQNLEDQIGSKIAEGIINTASNGEVKVKFDDLNSGKFNVETKEGTISIDGSENGGTFKMTDDQGKVSTYQGGEGAARPADAPADLPSPSGATDFNYFSADTIASLNYKVKDVDLKVTCDNIKSMLEGAGWTASTAGMNSEDADNILRSFEMPGYSLTESCSLTDGVPEISLIKSKKNS